MTQVTFLQDYRGILSGEIFYEEGQVVDSDEAAQPLKLEELLAAGRVSFGENVETEVTDSDIEDLMLEDLPDSEVELESMVEAGDLAVVEIEADESGTEEDSVLGKIMSGGW